MKKKWEELKVTKRNMASLRDTLPQGLRGRFGVKDGHLDETVLIIRVPEAPHRLYGEFLQWCKEYKISVIPNNKP